MICFVRLMLVPLAVGLALPQEPIETQSPSKEARQPQVPVPDSNSSIPEELPDEELAPAAVELDVSRTSPLIKILYQATRETKEGVTLERLAEAKRLIA